MSEQMRFDKLPCSHDRLNEDGICRRCGQDCRGVGPTVPFKQPKVLWQQSGISMDNRPFVQLLFDTEVVAQWTPYDAREFANNLMQVAEAAEQDALLCDFFEHNLRQTKQAVAQILIDIRKLREARGKKSPASDPKDFVVTEKHQHPNKEK